MGSFVVTSKNAMLDSLTVTSMSLHTADPGVTGLSNEVSGGSPAYARKSCVYDAAVTSERLLNADVTFDVPAATSVAYVGKWNAAVFIGSDLVTTEVFAAQGRYTVVAVTSKLSLTDA